MWRLRASTPAPKRRNLHKFHFRPKLEELESRLAPSGDPSLSVVTVSSPTVATGSTMAVILTAKDASGNQETTGGDSVNFYLGTGSAGYGTFSNLCDYQNGIYIASFTAISVGSVIISATINGQTITTPLPTVTVTQGPVAPGPWSYVAPMSMQRDGQTATLLDRGPYQGQVLVAGGADVNNNPMSSAELYDPVHNLWSPANHMLDARTEQTATLLNDGRVLVVGGVGPNGPLNTAELYDPYTGQWSYTSNTMSTPRVWHTETKLGDGRVLVAGGVGTAPLYNAPALNSLELFDPGTNSWTVQAQTMKAARANHTTTLLGTGVSAKVLVTGGGSATAELFDPTNDTWSFAAPMDKARSGHTATLLPNGKVLIAGGGDGGGDGLGGWQLYDPSSNSWSPSSDLLELDGAFRLVANLFQSGPARGKVAVTASLGQTLLFDPATNTWSPTGSMNTPREIGFAATLLSNGEDVLVTGGYNDDSNTPFIPFATAELYRSAAGSPWSTAGDMARPVFGPAIKLNNSDVLVMGGSWGQTFTGPQIYDPNSNTWSAAASMNTPRTSQVVTALDNGNVLVAAGFDAGGTLLKSVELYHPGTNTWGSGADMSTPRDTPAVTLLEHTQNHNGQVLVAGGYDANGNPLTSMELYSPDVDPNKPGSWITINNSISLPYQTATLLKNGKVLFMGAYDSNFNPITTTQVYDPDNNSWSDPMSMLAPSGVATATLLDDGDVLVTGGDANGMILSSAELFHPSTNSASPGGSWAFAGSMAAVRTAQTAALLSNGQVLVAGTQTAQNLEGYSSAELYDPSSNTWSSAGTLIEARGRHTAVLLDNGKVLIAGGLNFLATGDAGGIDFQAGAELFDRLTSDALTPPTAVVGQSLSNDLLLHFSDVDPAATVAKYNYDATIIWGDGQATAGQVVSDPSGVGFDVLGSHAYSAALANASFSVVVSDKFGVSTSQVGTITVSAVFTQNLQAAITSQLQANPSATTTNIQASTNADAQNVVSAVNGLSAQTTSVTVVLNLTPGTTLSDVSPAPPAGVTLIITGDGSTTTFVGQSPALTVTSGNVIVSGVIFTTATDAPTILVTGGSLKLRNDVIQESTGYSDAGLSITGGTVDLGTTADPGGDTLNVNGTGAMIANTTSNPVSPVGDTFKFNGVVPTVIIAGGTFTYDGTAHPATATVAGIVGATPALTYTDSSGHGVAAPVSPGTYTVAGSYVDSPNFVSATGTGTLTINRATPAIAWPALSDIAYGTPLGASQLNATASALINGRTVPVAGTFAYNPAAGTVLRAGSSQALSVTFTPSDTADFVMSSGSAIINVSKAPLTVTANNQTRAYGMPNSTFTVSYGGFVNGDTPASLGGALAFTTPATISSPVGSYPITPSGLTSANYAITFAPGTLSVTLPPNSVYVLNSSAGSALTISQNAAIHLPGTLVVDSTSTSAISASGIRR
jgi:N-acetylneuraminic acid mutarotase